MALEAQHFLALWLKEALHYTFGEVLSRHAGNSIFGSYVRVMSQAQYFVQLANCWQLRAAGEVPLEVFLCGKCNIW